jgi:hypothetical protein
MLELPHEAELARQYEQAGLVVVGVNADEEASIAKAAAEKHRLPWLNVFEGPDQPISKRLGIRQWPTLMLIDSSGRVISTSEHLRASYTFQTPDGEWVHLSGLDLTLHQLLGTN